MYNFQHLAKDVHLKEHQEPHSTYNTYQTGEGSEEMAADESTLQLSVQGSEHSIENPLSSGSNADDGSEPTPKKKRKTNTQKAIIEDHSNKGKSVPTNKALKLKKSKSESNFLP